MPSRLGLCGVRYNRNGRLYLSAFGRLSRIEEKEARELPLSGEIGRQRFLFVGSQGCNMRCVFCNEWRVSQAGAGGRLLSPAQLVDMAKERKVRGIAFTYNETAVGLEYLLEVSEVARPNGLAIAVQTNAFLLEKPFRDLMEAVDFLVVDLKGWDSEFYRIQCGGDKKDIYRNLRIARSHPHLEVSFLVMEGINDSERDFREMVAWLANLNDDLPFHLIRFKPAYQWRDMSETSTVRLYQLQKIARNYLRNTFVKE